MFFIEIYQKWIFLPFPLITSYVIINRFRRHIIVDCIVYCFHEIKLNWLHENLSIQFKIFFIYFVKTLHNIYAIEFERSKNSA